MRSRGTDHDDDQPRRERGERGERGGRRGRRGGRGRNNRGPREDRGEEGDAGSTPAESYSADHPAPAPEPALKPVGTRSNAPRNVEPQEPRVRDYETVNEVTGDKKKGWWKKLTG